MIRFFENNYLNFITSFLFIVIFAIFCRDNKVGFSFHARQRLHKRFPLFFSSFFNNYLRKKNKYQQIKKVLRKY